MAVTERGCLLGTLQRRRADWERVLAVLFPDDAKTLMGDLEEWGKVKGRGCGGGKVAIISHFHTSRG